MRALAAGADAICVGGDHADEGPPTPAGRHRGRRAHRRAARGAAGGRRRPGAALAGWTGACRGARPARGAASPRPGVRSAGRPARGPPRRQGHRRRALAADRPAARGRVRPAAQHRDRCRDAVGRRRANCPAAARHGDRQPRRGGPGARPWPAAGPPARARGPRRAPAPLDRRRRRTLLAARPDAIVVEMGVPQGRPGGVHIATHGATRACGRAAAEVIAGGVATRRGPPSRTRAPRRGRPRPSARRPAPRPPNARRPPPKSPASPAC